VTSHYEGHFTHLESVVAVFLPLPLLVVTEFLPISPLSSSSVGWRYLTRLLQKDSVSMQKKNAATTATLKRGTVQHVFSKMKSMQHII